MLSFTERMSHRATANRRDTVPMRAGNIAWHEELRRPRPWAERDFVAMLTVKARHRR